MNLQQVNAKVIEIISDQLGISKEQITDLNKTFVQLGGDRLDSIELLITLEDELEIEIINNELGDNLEYFQITKTISEIQSLIQKKLNITE